MRSETDTTSRLGVAAVDTFFSRHGWLFREQPIHDWEIDAQIEPKEKNRPSGRLLALQIKTGKSWFASENSHGVRHAVSDWHEEYWLRHQLPIFILLHDPETGVTIWQKVEAHLVKRSKSGKAYIRIPRSNILNEKSLEYFEAGLAGDPTSFKRNHLAIDYPIMCAVRDAKSAYLQIMEMNHKSLNMRGAWFRLNDEAKSEPDYEMMRWLPFSSLHAYMAWAFPYLDYEHTTPLPDPLGIEEAEMHKLKISLNSLGSSFLTLENYYQNGAIPKSYDIPYEEQDEMDDDEYADWAYQRAMEKD